MSRLMSRLMSKDDNLKKQKGIRIKLRCNTYNRGKEERENENNVKYI